MIRTIMRKPSARLRVSCTVVVLQILSANTGLLQARLLHGVPQRSPPPVPHWVVLLVVVPALWLVISAAVLVVDRLLQRLEDYGKR